MEQHVIKIAVTGEGSTDYGKRKYGTDEWDWGPIAVYINKIAEEKNRIIELYPIEREDIKRVQLHRSMRGLEGKAIPARKFAIKIKENNLNHGIYYCDADKDSHTQNDERQAQRQFQKVHDEIAQGLTLLDVDAIPMVALRMIEAWILGDKRAIENALSINIKESSYLGRPELLWGSKNDPRSNYPKNVLDRVIKLSDKKYSDYNVTAEDFCKIADETDIAELKRTCSISFGAFYEEYCNLLERNC
ncbi:DUF4276 family protein [Butyrivibrio sp. FC2001]|uniref:DUF4276 family protein n=1 Tax=Butyrivibrio sp. FC2001 TaxID=1280671 RepID=UPI0004288224|nr:DUF4276 family protein [Butyrivibrio sp. FC2001]